MGRPLMTKHELRDRVLLVLSDAILGMLDGVSRLDPMGMDWLDLCRAVGAMSRDMAIITNRLAAYAGVCMRRHKRGIDVDKLHAQVMAMVQDEQWRTPIVGPANSQVEVVFFSPDEAKEERDADATE